MSDFKLPDFLWQHCYGKRWISYTAKENDMLNKAAKRWQKSVSLVRTDKKHIVAHLDEMYQENKISKNIQNIRCLVYNNGSYSWLYFDPEENEWRSYTPRLVVFLELAYTKKFDIVKFYENEDFTVNLKAFEEIEEKSNTSVAVMRDEHESTHLAVDRKHVESSEIFQELLTDESINLGKRLMNLPSMSSARVSNVSNHVLDISNTTLSPCPPNLLEFDERDMISLEVDAKCSEGHKYRLYSEEGSVYTASLSFVSINDNMNKFFIIQLFKHKQRMLYALWTRFGRMGLNGQSELVSFYSLDKAKVEFETRFIEKTGVSWKDKGSFSLVSQKYFFLETDLSPEREFLAEDPDLDPAVLSLMETITSQEKIKDIMNQLQYDYGYIPLGRLTLNQLRDGYQALKTITDTLQNTDEGERLLTACERFYMIIPHNFGRKRPLLIQNEEDIKMKMDLLETLWHLREKETLLSKGFLNVEHPFDVYYNSFHVTLEHLDRCSPTFIALDRCLQETHGPTHKLYYIVVKDAFRCNSKDYELFDLRSNVRLLWHGSRLTNWISILCKGLQVAPPEAPSTGSMLGKGLYFADVGSKSANYCLPTKKENEGLLLLCEVALGNTLCVYHSNDKLPENLPPEFASVFYGGKISPTFFISDDLSPTAVAPFGPFVDGDKNSDLWYNEYVVYKPELVRMKYLLRVKFIFE